MNLNEIFKDKTINSKARTELISNLILENNETVANLIDFASKSKDAVKATCIEALEFASKSKPEIVDFTTFIFLTESLADKAPRTKWESARVIGNTAFLFKDNLQTAVKNLLINSSHEGTVVRWSAAFALAEILLLKTEINNSLIPAVEIIIQKEEKNSIKKIYSAAVKKIKKL